MPVVSPALSNSREEYLLNGDFVVSMFKREVKVGNAVIEYSGSDHIIERINCTDRIDEEIVVQVFSLLYVMHCNIAIYIEVIVSVIFTAFLFHSMIFYSF